MARVGDVGVGFVFRTRGLLVFPFLFLRSLAVALAFVSMWTSVLGRRAEPACVRFIPVLPVRIFISIIVLLIYRFCTTQMISQSCPHTGGKTTYPGYPPN